MQAVLDFLEILDRRLAEVRQESRHDRRGEVRHELSRGYVLGSHRVGELKLHHPQQERAADKIIDREQEQDKL